VAGAVIGRVGAHFARRGTLSPERVATALYRGILAREPDLPGLAQKAKGLRDGDMLEHVIRTFVASPEFQSRFLQDLVPPVPLPDLTALMPERYETQMANGYPAKIYVAREDADMTLMASLIEKHRFYDRFGVWTPVIDFDKLLTAATVRGLGARSCFELGCFTGPVLSVLADAGVAVAGADVSHLAFSFAYPNIRDVLVFGDLLDLKIDRVFDVVLCMDVIEHLNPLLLDDYIAKIASLLDDNGAIYLNSPMWGHDRIFGIFEEPYLDEWQTVGDASCWRHWPCDHLGWPAHGHLVWGSPGWWERKFQQHGLVRDSVVETAIHQVLSPVFDRTPGRRTCFVLRRAAGRQSSAADAARMVETLSSVPGVSDLHPGNSVGGVAH
jgi:SAM-dependent methyltransferase